MTIFYRAMAFCAVVFCAVCAAADGFKPHDDVLTLNAAVRATLAHNPQLAGYALRVQALDGEQQTAALTPPLRAAAEMENVAGSGAFKGVDAAELTLLVSSVIELGGQRDARLGVVSARQQQLASSQRVATLEVLTQVTQQFIRLAAGQEQLKLLQQAQVLALENIQSLNRQVQAGRTPEAELLRAKAAWAKAGIEQAKVEQLVRGERVRLAAFWGEARPVFTQVKADVLTLPPLIPLATLSERLAFNPDLALLGDEVQLRKQALRQARAEGDAEVSWSAGVRRLQMSEDSALVVGLSVPLGAKGRAVGAVATASAQQAGAEQEQAQAKVQLQAQLVRLHGALQQALEEVNSLRGAVLLPLQQAMRATAEAFAQGRYSYLEFHLAQRELLETQLALIDAAARAHLLSSEIERLTPLQPNLVNAGG